MPTLLFTLWITGWYYPTIDFTQHPQANYDDPIFHHLGCPTLTRLDLSKGESRPELLSREISIHDNLIWELEFQSDLNWWSGEKATTEDLKTWLENDLAEFLKNNANYLGEAIPFHILKEEKNKLKIVWKKTPVFGPYVFNFLVPWKKRATKNKNQPSWECLGQYKIENSNEQGYELASTYHNQKINVLYKEEIKKDERQINFSMAHLYDGGPWQRLSDEKIACDAWVDVPVISMIEWNQTTELTQSSAMRKIFTQSIPRGELLRTGAGGLGDLVSAPILRTHPGYNKKVLVRPFDGEKSKKQLMELGWAQKFYDTPRILPLKNSRLNLLTMSDENAGVTEKIISDAMTTLGIDVNIDKDHSKNYHGVIKGVFLTFPYLYFHLEDPHHLMKNYFLSLTEKKPNFNLLQKVHEKFYEEEQATVLMQHRSCVTWSGLNISKKQYANGIDINQPGWLTEIIQERVHKEEK